jgi:hypothetical protein
MANEFTANWKSKLKYIYGLLIPLPDDTTKFFRGDGTFAVPPGGGGAVWGAITGTLSSQTDLQTALDGKQPLDADLTAIAALGGTGIAVRSAANTWVQRLIAGTANEITVSDGTGVAGNPTISIPTAVTFTGKTVTGGTYSGATLSGTTTFVNGITMGAVVAPNGMGFSWDVNNFWAYRITNPNVGVAAAVEFQTYNASKHLALGILGTGYTTALPYRQGGAYVFSDATGGLSIITGGNNSIYMVINEASAPMVEVTANTVVIGTGSSDAAVGLWARKDRDGGYAIEIDNASAGVAASCDYYLYNGTVSAHMGLYGTGFTTAGLARQNGLRISSGGAGGVTIDTTANQPIYFGINSIEAMRLIGTGLSIGGAAPATSAKLDLQGTDGALLISRLTTAQRDALTPANGMEIYNTTLGKFQVYEAGAWTNMVSTGVGGDLGLNKHVIASNFTVTAAYASYITRYMEISAAVSFEIGADADLEIG